MVGVAQLVEPRIVIPVVVGSSPIVHPNFNSQAFITAEIQAFQTRIFETLKPLWHTLAP